ncbi:hypothetical protein F5Y19DRAFT_438107 [Xylariaceae sp. FL1651]|nr:hypothetical protein F5Y19DRAFT_438107 [Xylariaceae sp. FL1651]
MPSQHVCKGWLWGVLAWCKSLLGASAVPHSVVRLFAWRAHEKDMQSGVTTRNYNATRVLFAKEQTNKEWTRICVTTPFGYGVIGWKI